MVSTIKVVKRMVKMGISVKRVDGMRDENVLEENLECLGVGVACALISPTMRCSPMYDR
jgi:hypothetical protein